MWHIVWAIIAVLAATGFGLWLKMTDWMPDE